MKRYPLLSFTILALAVLSPISCKKTMFELSKELKGYGYLTYPTPLEFSGPGTLVGGGPTRLHLVASPDTCFPDVIDGVKTDLRRTDHTTLPRKNYKFSASGETKVKLFNFLATGTPTISAGTKFHHVHTVDIEMIGVHIEYLDSIKLTEFYRQSIPQICKDYLDSVGFIIQAMKVDQMNFQFKTSSGQTIFFDLQNLEDIVDVSANVEWEIENNITLTIKTPKYIGFQLGSLRHHENGMALYRSASTKKGKFIFKPIALFNDLDDSTIPKKGPFFQPAPDVFHPLKEQDDLDNASVYEKPKGSPLP